MGAGAVGRTLAWGIAVPLLVACQSMLPRATTETPFGWNSYADAENAINSIQPYHTRRDDLAKMGIDATTNASITILNFSDVAQRFSAASALAPEELDRGLRDCLKAGRRCSGYSIQIRNVKRQRIGSFWLDFLNFNRDIDVTGWTFSGLIVLVDDLVVYALPGGQPRIVEYERSRNPLGPLQGLGDQIRPASLF